jgi:phosphoserine phosphatase RsbU/P
MEPARAEVPPDTETIVALDMLDRLIEALRQMAVAVAPYTGAAIAYCGPASTQWITASDSCPCSRNTGAALPCLEGGGVEDRYRQAIDVWYEGRSVGAVVVCCDLTQQPIQQAICHLVRATIRRLEVEQENDSLLEELSVSWESLEAVYEISSDLRLLQNPRDLLHRITKKAAAIQEGLRAILWLEEAGQLAPVAIENAVGVQSRGREQGLLGQVLAERSPVIFNGRPHLVAIHDLDPELQRAASVAIVPVATRQGILGALEVWQEHGRSEFDSGAMRLLEALALQAAMVIENDRLHRESIESERLRQEVEIGSTIQQMLLLGQPPCSLPGIQLAALTIPSQRIDGDFYEFITHSDQCLDIIVGDVMGKGVPAALLGAATKSHFLRAINRLLSPSVQGRLAEPQEIVTLVAAEVAGQLIGLESFVTVCYARFDMARRRVDFVDCGHTRTIHFRRSTGACELLHGSNLPLGVIEGEVYQQISTPFADGDIFLFYSDGLTEARDRRGSFFGEEQLAELVRANSHLEPQPLLETMRLAVTAFSLSGTFADDLTGVVVKIAAGAEHNPIAQFDLEIASQMQELARVRAFVRGLWLRLPASAVSEDSMNELELAVSEALVNIVSHAYHGSPGQRIRVEADVFEDRIVVRLYDWGRSFDPAKVEPPAFDGSKESGFGVYIIAHTVDEVNYWRDDQGRNCISLQKMLKKPERENG